MSRKTHAETGEQEENTVIHEVDGIEEYDNKLPNWWLYTLYGTIGFGIIYWYAYQTTGIGLLPRQAYQDELDKAAAAEAMQIKVGEATPESLMALSKDPKALALGKQVFTSTCAACHRADGGGNVGPNLTDEFWLHGAAPESVFQTVAKGVPDKGMPAWQPQLGPLRTQAVTAYVITLRGTNAAGGKAPQGDRVILGSRE